jgi:hypothetical protein
MTFLECVDLDLKEAMRARETTKVDGLRMLKSALKYALGPSFSVRNILAERFPLEINLDYGDRFWLGSQCACLLSTD